MRLSNIKWYRCGKAATEKGVSNIESKIQIKLPRLYYDIMMICDAGVPLKTDFEYDDKSHECMMPQAIGCFLGLEDPEYNIGDVFKNPPEFFPEGLVAFAETGGGDYICFDYREGKDNIDPPIVYWNHEADVGKDVSFVANNFEEFLGMLREPEDE
ncbi:MAG: SMI1/KNR4 family protein [Proteobacteria bacterium]|nr:SMI1/KNR4 family protein [Pseudomonadota bacterium]